MESAKVSIIIPVFKAEKTLCKCLDSIVAQTLSEWEGILVDDGSPDACGQICDEYATKDSRFRIIHQQNAGVSAARQAGLETVTGEYVIHSDPDDWVEPQMLEELYRKAVAEDADMVICDMYKDFGVKCLYYKQDVTDTNSHSILNDIFRNKIHGSCCNKLVKRSCMNKYGAKFPKGVNYCEDVCFLVQLLKHDINITYLNKAYYHYVQNQGSITNAYTIETLKTHQKYVQFLTEQLPEDSLPVVTSKEFVKKLAYRSAVLSNSDFRMLYPEIMSSHGDSFLVGLMYNLAFRGHYQLAGLLRIIYRKLH